MSFLSWLLGRAPRTDDPPPTSLINIRLTTSADSTGVRLIATVDYDPNDPSKSQDSDEPVGIDTPENQPLENMYCMIEYIDAAGIETRRPITMISLSRHYTVPCIVAVCHTRHALRSFRIDRIKNVITADGEVFDGRHFLTDIMQLDLLPADFNTSNANQNEILSQIGTRARRQDPSPRVFREIMLAPLTVLVACGKADGHFHPDEVDRIMSWAEIESMRLHRDNLIDADMTLDEANAIGKIIATMRPQQRTIQRHMLATLTMDPERLARFRRALHSVIIADGVTHDLEVQFLAEFDRLAEIAKIDPDAVIEKLAEASGSIDLTALPNVNLNRAVFVFTGSFVQLSRRQAMSLVEARNGIVKNNVGISHRYNPGSCLVWGTGGGGGSKRETAIEVGMPIISEDMFLARMGLA